MFIILIIGLSASQVPISFLEQVQGYRPLQAHVLTLSLALSQLILLPMTALLLACHGTMATSFRQTKAAGRYMRRPISVHQSAFEQDDLEISHDGETVPSPGASGRRCR